MVDSLPNNSVSSYTSSDHRLKITKTFASEQGNILVDYSPVVLRQKNSGDTWKEIPSYTSVGMALSRYLPASFLGHGASGWKPDYGADQWPDVTKANVNLNDGAQSLYKAMWSLRGQMRPEVLDRAILKAWTDTQDSYRDSHYHSIFCERLLGNLPADQREITRGELLHRGLITH